MQNILCYYASDEWCTNGLFGSKYKISIIVICTFAWKFVNEYAKLAQLDRKIETMYSMCDEKWNACSSSAKFSHFWLGKFVKMNVRLWDAVGSEFAWVNGCLVLTKICVACANTRGLNVMQETNYVKVRLAKVYE